MKTELPDSIGKAYTPEAFNAAARIFLDKCSDYLRQATGRLLPTVLPDRTPEQLLQEWKTPVPSKPNADLTALLERTIAHSNHLHHPRYIGHQVSAPLPLAALCDGLGSLLNNSSAVYEMGPVNTVCEKIVIQWLIGLAGYSERADGVFTSGGTLGNLTALMAARQVKADYDIWTKGIDSGRKHTVLVTEQAHYSIKRALAVMGLGEQAVVTVPTDAEYRLDVAALKAIYDRCCEEGKTVFAVVANACTTATGSFDPLEQIADFCEEHDLWMHVDGAHGASFLLSGKYRHLLKGVERADSLVWDTHKMMLMPSLITAVLFKEGRNSYRSFSQKASYLFEKEPIDEWYNYAHRTMECTKYMMGYKLYVPLMVYGSDLFADYVTSRIDLTREFAALIRSTGDFELAVEPACNIICFRYTGSGARTAEQNSEFQKLLRKKVLESEQFYIVQTRLRDGFYLRCTIINPLTTIGDLAALLDVIRTIARSYGG